jgi:hypothetical protein
VTQPLFTELGDPKFGSKIVDSRWNAFARTDVVTDPVSPDSFLLYTNGNVPTNMLKWNGQPWTVPLLTRDFPLSDWVYQSAELRDKRVLSIGPGGGLDALLALQHGAGRFDGAEINPDIVALMNEPPYLSYNGGIYKHPKVHVDVAEGRAFVREARAKNQKYQLIFRRSPKPRRRGRARLCWNRLFTPKTRSSITRRARTGRSTRRRRRRAAAAGALVRDGGLALQSAGMTEAQAGRHIAAVFFPQPGPYRWALVIVQKSADCTAKGFVDECRAQKRNLFPLWIPGAASSNELFPFGALGSGALSLSGFVDAGTRA